MKNRFSGFWKTFWKKGDFFTRLSLVVMGSGCFRFGQIVKGMDVVDAINALAVNDDQYPTGDPVVIESITLTTYGEIDA